MSEEGIELVKRHIGDEDLAQVVRDDRAWAARLADIEPHFAPDFEFIGHVPGDPIIGHGFDEYRARFLDWLEPWDAYQPNIEELIDLGDRVVALGHDHGLMQGVDGGIETWGAVIYQFHDGKVTRIDYYFDRAEGLRAAGLR